MAVKVNLQKAYDMLNWDFSEDTLKTTRSLENYISCVMICIWTLPMQINVNGSY